MRIERMRARDRERERERDMLREWSVNVSFKLLSKGRIFSCDFNLRIKLDMELENVVSNLD